MDNISGKLLNVGVSTSNMYPLETEVAICEIFRAGFKNVEIFLNSASEVEEELLDVFLGEIKRAKGNVIAVHAFTSCYEPYLFFSKYERRLHDGLEIYQRIYKFASKVGAKYVIMHGDKVSGELSYDESISRFKRVSRLGLDYGITLLLENAHLFRGSEIEYVLYMREKIGDYANFAFDLKQSLRAKLNYEPVIKAMGSSLKHVHISDNCLGNDCMVPGQGTVDYYRLFAMLKEVGYSGKYIIELYRDCFSDMSALKKGALFLEEVLANN